MLQQDRRNGLRQMARFLLPASAGALVISFFLKNRLPDKGAILESLRQDPVQTDTDLPGPFDVTRKGFTYLLVRFSWKLERLPHALKFIYLMACLGLNTIGKVVSDISEHFAGRPESGLTLLVTAQKPLTRPK